eukprot:4657357-Pleurochrysis_carterae.AAC.1
MSFAAAELDRRISLWFSSAAPFSLRFAVDSVLAVFGGLHTSALGEAALRSTAPFVQPRERVL